MIEIKVNNCNDCIFKSFEMDETVYCGLKKYNNGLQSESGLETCADGVNVQQTPDWCPLKTNGLSITFK